MPGGATTVLTLLDVIANVATSGGASTVRLAVAADENAYVVVDATGNAAANNITINAVDGALIDGAASLVLTSNGAVAVLVKDGGQWRRVGAERLFDDDLPRVPFMFGSETGGGGAASSPPVNSVQLSDGAGGFTSFASLLGGNGFLSVGTAPVSVLGNLRGANGFQAMGRNSANTADFCIFQLADTLYIGGDSASTNLAAELQLTSASSVFIRPGGLTRFAFDGATLQSRDPIVGYGAFGTPYGIHGLTTKAMADANQTLAGAEIGNGSIETTGALTAIRELTLATPANNDPGAYFRPIRNSCTGASVRYKLAAGTTVEVPPGQVAIVEVTTAGLRLDVPPQPANGSAGITQYGGRLSLTTDDPVPLSDVSAGGTLYFTPYLSGEIALYNGSHWVKKIVPQLSVSTAGMSASLPHDVFVEEAANANGASLTFLAWTSATARATALTRQDGVLVLTGATNRRYVGTVRTTAGSTINDSLTSRCVWNFQNRVPRPMSVVDATNNWTYVNANSVWRQANASTANQVEYVSGEPVALEATVGCNAFMSAAANDGAVGIGIDSSTVNSAAVRQGRVNLVAAASFVSAEHKAMVAAGYHTVRWLETSGAAADTITFYGDNGGTVNQAGLTAVVMA